MRVSSRKEVKRCKYPLIKQRYRNLDMTAGEVAERIEMHPATFSNKMHGHSPWTEPELQRLADELLQPDEGIDKLIQRRSTK